MIRVRLQLVVAVPVVLLLAACGIAEPTPTQQPAPTIESEPSPTPPELTTPTLRPTSTPKETATPSPTATTEKLPTPTPAPSPSQAPRPEEVSETDLQLTLPEGFRISRFTPEPIGPIRFMAFSPDGILFVSMPNRGGLYLGSRSGGTVFALPDIDQDGEVDEVTPVINGFAIFPTVLRSTTDIYMWLRKTTSHVTRI